MNTNNTNLRAKTPHLPTPLWHRLPVVLGFMFAGAVLIASGLIVLTASRQGVSHLLAMLLTATPTPPIATATGTATPLVTPSVAPVATATPMSTLTPYNPPTENPTVTGTPTPLPTPDAQDRQIQLPILMYHYISEPPPDADIYRLDLSVTPQRFREQMAWLSENGYETITLYDLIYALNIGWPPLPEKPVILTFDDGYVDNYENAFPILQEFGFIGTFFILTDVTDRSQAGYMTWDMLREMSQAGMDIEVHGREHVYYYGRDYDWLVFYLRGPAETIEANLGYRPRFIAYPSGWYDELTVGVARQEGYWGGLTTVQGTWHYKEYPFDLRRLRVHGDWTPETFIAVVGGS